MCQCGFKVTRTFTVWLRPFFPEGHNCFGSLKVTTQHLHTCKSEVNVIGNHQSITEQSSNHDGPTGIP